MNSSPMVPKGISIAPDKLLSASAAISIIDVNDLTASLALRMRQICCEEEPWCGLILIAGCCIWAVMILPLLAPCAATRANIARHQPASMIDAPQKLQTLQPRSIMKLPKLSLSDSSTGIYPS